ncbi:AsnC family transcriptional regulator [Sphingomonas histidinilytica]|uniref:Transcriptional regulator, AsnC family n=2 Tax=Rhizorhabdus histidinilytica TaxID=439228 RepID=A0A1T4ZZG8_9SPHN|nr:AsnC family transcriptional regulator [Rhizorhabdus histidinilytica]SKB27899.1 transcriptional regulator, AsnC family [Rhizorhabdus histidinilytica]
MFGDFGHLTMESGKYDKQMMDSIDLDDFDRRIIAIVRRDNQQPARHIADRVGLSESAVLRRLRRLRSSGVIVADVSLIDPSRLAPAITIHVLVELAQSGLKVEQLFARTLESRPEVIGAWNVTGRTDFLVTVSVPSIEAYQRFADEVLASDDNIRGFETLVSLREIVRFDPLRAGDPLSIVMAPKEGHPPAR